MLSKAPEGENTDNNKNTQPINFLFELCHKAPVIENLLSFLGAQDLQNFGKAICYQKSCHNLFYGCKEQYLKPTRNAQAQTLRDLVLQWDYHKIEVLVRRDPNVLSIVCDYKMNRWQKDGAIRPLSALEYAYLASDENFIELFERLGTGHLTDSCYQNKTALQEESSQRLEDLSRALSAYCDKKMSWAEFRLSWRDAPHWVYGLVLYFSEYNIKTVDQVNCANVFSEGFRRATMACCPPPVHKPWIQYGRKKPVDPYISVSHSHMPQIQYGSGDSPYSRVSHTIASYLSGSPIRKQYRVQSPLNRSTPI